MTEIAMKREGGHLVPATAYDADQLARLTAGKTVVMVSLHQERNPEHHKKLWALARVVADNCDDFIDAQDAVEWAKLQIPSMRRQYVFNDGKLVLSTKSISFASMDQLAFRNFYDRACALWSEKIGTDVETLEKEARRV